MRSSTEELTLFDVKEHSRIQNAAWILISLLVVSGDKLDFLGYCQE